MVCVECGKMGVTIGQVTQEDSSQENIPELEEIRTLLIPSSLIVHGLRFSQGQRFLKLVYYR